MSAFEGLKFVSVSILALSAGRWCKYRDMILGILKGLSDLE